MLIRRTLHGRAAVPLSLLAFAAATVGGAGARRAEPRRVGIPQAPRIDITNGSLLLGVLPSLGGRVVLLKTIQGENLLDSDPRFWSPPHPPPDLSTAFQPWNGRIVWVGPQSGFWSQQDVRPEARASGAAWPPDPFNEAGRFEVVERGKTRLRLKGRTSPVTGLAFEHEFEITGERTVRMRTIATNGRDTPVCWDLWPNTRVRPEGVPYVPLDPGQPPRVEGPKPEEREAGMAPHGTHEGWLTLQPPADEPQPPVKRLWAKAYVRPARGLIACFLGRELLMIRAPLVPQEKLHPEQAFVEIYRGAGKDATILELEMHGPYETLLPGSSMSFEQTFEVLDYDGPARLSGHLARLASFR